MRMRLAVAVIVAVVLAGAAGIVAEASFRVPVGMAQPQVRALVRLFPLVNMRTDSFASIRVILDGWRST